MYSAVHVMCVVLVCVRVRVRCVTVQVSARDGIFLYDQADVSQLRTYKVKRSVGGALAKDTDMAKVRLKINTFLSLLTHRTAKVTKVGLQET